MPKRTDLNSILIIGSGPIIIGQSCEFDYSGTQACRAIKEEGYRVILVNSNPATIMTDKKIADATYLEPITVHSLEAIIKKPGICRAFFIHKIMLFYKYSFIIFLLLFYTLIELVHI